LAQEESKLKSRIPSFGAMDVVGVQPSDLDVDAKGDFGPTPSSRVSQQSTLQTVRHRLQKLASRLPDQCNECEPSLSMAWKDLNFSIGKRQILTNVTGIIHPGRLTGVFGPSGSGKSTLLNILGGRQNTKASGHSLSGEISINGKSIEPVQFRQHIAYVMQDDALPSTETPRECLQFSARLRLPREVGSKELDSVVEQLLATLNLSRCADTLVGGAIVKGISGGEKKRTAVGVELISNPKMLFLDEPLSGLDSFSANRLTEALKTLAEADVPVLCTLHQPSSQIFAMFKDVVILHAGGVVFHGPAEQLAGHFEGLGYPCPESFNPADHVMFLLQKSDADEIQQVKQEWLSSRLCADMLASLRLKGESLPGEAAVNPSFCTQLFLLVRREVRSMMRNYRTLLFRLFLCAALSAGTGWLFAGSGSRGNGTGECGDDFSAAQCTTDFQAHYGAVSSLAIQALMGAAQPTLLSFPQERPTFLREYASNQYGVVPYFIAKTLVELPVLLVSTLIILLVNYWLIGLEGSFPLLVLVLWGLGLASSSTSFLIGSSVGSAQQAIQLAPLTLFPQLLFSGLLLPISKIPVSLGWLRWVCPLKYAIDLVTVVEFWSIYESISGCESTLDRERCIEMMPGDYLRASFVDNQNVQFDQWPQNLAGLLGLAIGLRLLAVLMLRRKGRYVY